MIARISSKEIDESSGRAVSKCQQDVFLTHNDSGGGPFIYAFDPKGESLATLRHPNVRNMDWEDISSVKTSAGECFLYISEFGHNDRKREVHEIYRVREPQAVSTSVSAEPLPLANVDELRFRYPAERHYAEALLVHPFTRAIYVVTKEFQGPAHVYPLDLNFRSVTIQTASKIAEVSLPASPNGFVTGGDISADGKRIVLCDYYAGHELILPEAAKDFNEVWEHRPAAFDLGPREIGESVANGYDGDTVYSTTEKPNAPFIRVTRK